MEPNGPGGPVEGGPIEERMEEIWNGRTEDIVRLSGDGPAEYVELRRTPEGSDFDFVAHWYDARALEIEDYVPEDAELAEAAKLRGDEPVAIKWFDDAGLEDWELVEEDEYHELYRAPDGRDEIRVEKRPPAEDGAE